MERWFTKDFREREPKKIAVDQPTCSSRPKPEGYIANGEAVRDMDHREIIKSITAPTWSSPDGRIPATTVELAKSSAAASRARA